MYHYRYRLLNCADSKSVPSSSILKDAVSMISKNNYKNYFHYNVDSSDQHVTRYFSSCIDESRAKYCICVCPSRMKEVICENITYNLHMQLICLLVPFPTINETWIRPV